MAKLDRIQSLSQSPQWQQDMAQKGEALKTMPVWQQYGFGSEQQYNNIYRPEGAPAPASPPTPAPSSDPFGDYLRNNPGRRDAWAYLESLLSDYGLQDLTGFIKDNIIEGRSEDEIKQRLREHDVYKKRFAVIEERKKRGLPAMSPEQVVAWEKSATAIMRRAGLPEGFYDDPEDFYNFQLNDWSVDELNAVVNEGYMAAQQADPEVRQQLQQLYGIDAGHLAAFFIDPERGEKAIMRQFNAAGRAAIARQTGYGQISSSEAESLVGLGVDDAAARQGFTALAENRELFGAPPGENADDIGRDTQFNAAFRGDVEAQRRIAQRGQGRVGNFRNSGGYANDREGFAGIGRAR